MVAQCEIGVVEPFYGRPADFNDLLRKVASLPAVILPCAGEHYAARAALRRVLGDERGLVGVLNSLANWVIMCGDLAGAVAYLTQALAYDRPGRDGWILGCLQANQGHLAARLGDYDHARQY